jgi:hypothetical protein
MKPNITITYTNAKGKKIGKIIELPNNDDEWARAVISSAVGVVNQIIEQRAEFDELEADRLGDG